MRTAVVRIGVDPAGELSPDRLRAGMARLQATADQAGAEVIDNDLAVLPPTRREAEILMTGADPAALQAEARRWCADAFATEPVLGVLTFVSHGTDDDARGVLAGFGLGGVVERVADPRGWDILTVTLRRGDMARIPESRVHTALEASTNCEVRIVLSD
jgi:hypothetical protein